MKKTIRWTTLALIWMIAFSAWTPAPALAAGMEKTRPALVNLTVTNRTFGALQVSLEGNAGSYLFYAPQGKTTYQIAPGKYTYTISFASTSLCKNWKASRHKGPLVKTGRFTNPKNNLGPYSNCTLW